MILDLSNRTAIVTGGAGFLGASIVAGLTAAGCRVAVIDRAVRSSEADEKGLSIACDLSDENETNAAFAKVWEALGPVSILVNAVGHIYSAPLVNIASAADRRHSLDAWNATLNANLTSVFLATACQVDHMTRTRTRGVVVNISSISAVGNAGQTAYSAAKAGVNAMTIAWAKELGLMGIRFVAVSPGFIDTPSTHDALGEGLVKDIVKRTPVRRLGKAEDVTHAVLFAIQNEHMTGRIVEVDGGLVL